MTALRRAPASWGTAALASSTRQGCRSAEPLALRSARSAGRFFDRTRRGTPASSLARRPVAACRSDGWSAAWPTAECPSPEIVVNELLMPDPLAGASIDRDERVGVQVVAFAIAAVEVVTRGAESDERDAVLLVDRELAPVVHATADLVMAFRPRVVAELAFVRNDMEDPRELPRPNVVGVNVGGRSAVVRSTGQRDDEEVLEDSTGIAGPDRTGRLPLHRVAQIDTAVVTEGSNELTILCIHGDHVTALQVDEPAVGSIRALPVVHAARARRRDAFLAPDLLAGRRVDRGERAAANRGVHHAVDDDGIEDAVAGDGEGPGHVELRDVLL